MKETKQNLDEHIFTFTKLENYNDAELSDVEVLRVGTIQDRGLQITMKMLTDYIKNFQANVYGTEVQVNLEHNRGSEAAGWVKDLFIKGVSLFAKVEWTELGKEKISKNLFKFVSAELAPKYPHFENGKAVNNVFIGLALTNTPALKGQMPISLEETNQITNVIMFKTFLNDLKNRAIVSKDDKNLLKKLSDELPEDEQEEVAAEIAEVEAMPEEAAPVEEVKTEEAPEASEEAPAEPEVLTEKQVSLKLAETTKELTQLKEKVARRDLGDKIEGFMLSETNETGFLGEVKNTVLNFMISLDDEQQVSFFNILKSIKHVDLSTKGKATDKGDGDEDDLDEEEKLTSLASKMLSDGKAKDIEDAQKQAKKALDKKDEACEK